MKTFDCLGVSRTCAFLCTAVLFSAGLLGNSRAQAQASGTTTYPGQIGVEVSDRPTGFVDAFKDQGRLFSDSNGNAVPTDANGWPTADGIGVIFDNRAVPAWAPPIDDPSQYQPDCSGTYTMSFTGQATLASVAGQPSLTFTNQIYNAAANITTVNVTLPAGQPSLMVISFSKTQRTAASGTNTGITNLQVIRPNMPAAALNQSFGQPGLTPNGQVFDPAFLTSLAPFGYLRFMGWLGTNFSAGYYGDTGHHLIQWTDRSLPTDAYQGIGTSIRAGAEGISWEYVLLLANASNKDIWINIPVSATGSSDTLDPTYDTSTNSYIYQLALFLKNGNPFTGNQGLNPGLHIYLEHSNEVWNFGFSQYTWNQLAAQDEVSKGNSPLNNDGDTNQSDWGYRRHAKRLYEAAQIFQQVFGAGSLNTTIRPVYAWWQLDEGASSNAAKALSWMSKTYGPPSNYFYAMAQGDYFTAANYANDTTIPDVLSDMQASSTASVSYVQSNLATANLYGLKLFTYEGGPDNSNGGTQSTTNIGVQIEANRDPGMDTLVQNHIRNNWFGQGGSLFGYFALSTAYARYGSYGATDDYRNLTTAKYNAIVNVLGYTNGGVPVAPGNLAASAGNQQVLLSWSAVPGASSYNIKRALVTGGPYSTLGTVSSSSYTDSAVTNGTTYYYVVTAVNTSGESAPSNEASATPVASVPAAPASLTATAGNGQAQLAWSSVAGATSYNVYEGTTAGGESTTPVATAITTTSYTVPSLTNGTVYYFVVSAVNGLGVGAASNEASVTPSGPPAAPAGLSAAAADGKVTLTWTGVAGATSYNIYQGTASSAEGTMPIAAGVTATTYTATGLDDGTAYYFTVSAVNGAGTSAASNEASATPSAAPPPNDLLAYEPFGEPAGFLDQATGGGDNDWAGPWVVQNDRDDTPGYNIANTTPLTYTGLTTNGNYAIGGDVYVGSGRPLNVAAGGPFNSYLSNGLIGAPGQTIWVSFLMRKDSRDGQTNSITLNSEGGTQSWWVASPGIAAGYFGSASNDGSGNPFWSLQYNGVTVQSNVPIVIGQPALLVLGVTFAASGAQNQVNLYVNPISLGGNAPASPSAQYSTASSLAFQSFAYYGGDGSSQSSIDELRVGASFAAVTPVVAVAPAPPANLTAIPGNAQVQLSWTAVTGATSYQVWDTTGGNYGEVAANVTTTTYTATSLNNNTAYTFYVTASNSAGTSGASNFAQATPVAPTPPAAPAGLAATAANGEAALSWTAVAGAVSYNIYQGSSSGAESTTPIATGVTAATYTVTGLANGTAYYFTVAAVNSYGAGGYSNEASATPGFSYGTPVPITVPNYSFELDQQASYIVPQDWTYTGVNNGGTTTAQQVGNTAIPGVTGTYYWSPLDCGNGSSPFGSETITLVSSASLGTFAANTQYVLTVAIGAQNPSATVAGIQLLANGTVVANFAAPVTGNAALTATQLQDYSLSFATSNQPQVVGQSITAALIYTYNGQYCRNAFFDNVRLTQAQAIGAAPNAPTGLSATAGQGQVALAWSAVSGAASYNVYQGAAAGAEGATPIATGVTVATYTVTGLTAGSTYYFTVAAVNSSGGSAVSNEASATPTGMQSAGSGLLAYEPFGETSGIVLNGASGGGDSGWGAAWVDQNGTGDIPGYDTASATPVFYPGLVSNGNYAIGGDAYTNVGRQLDVTASGPFASYLNNGMIGAPGQTLWISYLLRKDASDGQQNSLSLNSNGSNNSWYVQSANIAAGYFGSTSNDSNGNPFWALQFGSAYATPVATAITKKPVQTGVPALLVMQVTFGASGAQNQVNLYVNPATGGAAPTTPDAQYSTASSIAFQSLTYYGGDGNSQSSIDEIRVGSSFDAVTPAAPIVLPGAPTSLTAAPGSASATLSWSPVAGATSYNIYQGTTAGGEGTTPVASGINSTTYSAGNLTNGTAYYFVVAAVNASGIGAVSNEASATPQPGDGIPQAPAGLAAAAGDMQVTLTWSAVPGAASYNVYQATSSGGEGTSPVAGAITGTTYLASGLNNGSAYFYKIAAVNSYGTSALSTEATATPTQPIITGTNKPADFSIYSQVLATNPVPVGFNMQPAAGSNITENAWLADGSFSPYDARISFTASQDGSATTFIATGGGGTSFYQSIAANYFVGATAHTYRYANGAWSLLRTDTVSGYAANSASTAPADNTITFASSGPQILSGDITWLDLDNVAAVPNVSQLDPRFTVYYPTWSTESQTGQQRNATAPWPFTLSSDVPSSDAGGLSLELVDNTAETNGIWQYMQGVFVGPAYEQFQPGHTYEVDLWLKQSGVANGSVTFFISGLNVSHTFTGVNDTWQHFTWSFPAVAGLPANSAQPAAHLDFSAPGTMWVDNFQLYDSGWAPNSVNPQVMQAWTDFHPGTMRIWSNFGTSSEGYAFLSLDSWITPEIKTRNTPGIGNEYESPAQLEHLPDSLANVKTVGANPWLIVNMALSEVEWGELIDYLSAPAGVGYAAKRPASHPGPYTDDFATIYLEVGNEEWGTQSVPVDFAYGQWTHFVASQAISGKSYFDASKIKFIANGFFLNPTFGSTAAKAAPEVSVVDYALYSGGNSSLTGDAYYQSDLEQLPATNKPIIDSIVAQQQLDAAGGRSYGLAAYEEGPGADTAVHNGDTSLAAGVAAADVALYASQSGFGPQNFFLYELGSGPYTSHSNFANGFRPHPVWEALQMRNLYCNGPMMWVNPNSVPASTDGNNYPLIGVYAFQDANNQADIVVISRDLNNQTPVTLHFPATPTGSAQLYTLTGDPRGNNDSAMNIPIGSQTVTITANYTFNMPPGSMYIFQVPMTGAWTNNEPAPSAPSSLNAVADNGKVELTWTPSQGATSYNILRGTVSGGPYTQIGSASGTGYTDTSVTNGTTYYYVVEASDPGGSSANSPEASATPNLENAGFTTAQPPLDGTSGGSWASVPAIAMAHHFAGTSPDTATYKTLWDSTYLYVLVSVQDSTLSAPTEAQIWSGDTVELYFSGTDSKSNAYGPTDFQYAFPYGSAGATVTEADHSAVTGVILGQTAIAGGYQMTIALPWTTLGTAPVAGQQYGFDVMVDDATTPGTRLGKLAWWGTEDETWSNPSLMGPLVLGKQASTPSKTMLASTPTSPKAGAQGTLTATVTGTGATPTGKVVFSAGSITLCTANLNASGVATCSYTPAASGLVTITASYQGDGSNLASTAMLPLVIIDGAISLELSSTQLVYPGAANVTVCIAPAGKSAATGAVGIYDGTTLLHSQSLQGNGCAYWYISPGLAAGTHTITAGYSGDSSNPAGISTSTTVNVAPVPVTMSVSCWNASFAYGANYQCTVNASSSAGPVAGAITYSVDGSAPVNVPLSSGNAKFTLTKPASGSHTVTISYAQQTNYAAAAAQKESFTVTPAPVNVALTPSTYYTKAGTSISFTVAVTSSSAGSPNSTGSVAFDDGSTLLGTVAVNSSGKAVLTTNSLKDGSHTIKATYSGGTNYASGSASATITIAN